MTISGGRETGEFHEPTEPSLAEKRQRIRALYEEGWKRHALPFMPEVTDARGVVLERQSKAPPGGIEFDDIPENDRAIHVANTGTGFIGLGNAELITKELTGCQAVLVLGKTKDGKPLNALFHMTPTTKLGWGNFRAKDDDAQWGHGARERNAKKVADALDHVGADKSTLTAHFIRTAGDPPREKYSGYGEDHLQAKTKDLMGQFEAQGIRSRAVKPLPLEVATIYWSPEAPQEIYAVGEKRLSVDGGVIEPQTDARGVDAIVIALDQK